MPSRITLIELLIVQFEFFWKIVSESNRIPFKRSKKRLLSKQSLPRDFLKMDKKALAKFINFFLEDICQNHIKVICSYAQQ